MKIEIFFKIIEYFYVSSMSISTKPEKTGLLKQRNETVYVFERLQSHFYKQKNRNPVIFLLIIILIGIIVCYTA